MPGTASVKVDRLDVSVYTVPTEEPESDGTFLWTATMVVVAQPRAGGVTGLGFTYGTPACASVIHDLLEPVVLTSDPLDVTGTWRAMVDAIATWAGRGSRRWPSPRSTSPCGT